MQDKLYELIMSLSKSERRYFSINGGNKDSRHFKLYLLIKNMKVYDDQKVKDIYGKNWSAEKNYLYNLILKCMRSYHSEKSAYFQIKELTLDAQFLMERGLYEQSMKRLDKAKGLAENYERNADALEINQLERRLLLRTKPTDFYEKILMLVEEQDLIAKKIEEETFCSKGYQYIAVRIAENTSLSAEEKATQFFSTYFPKNQKASLFLSRRSAYYYLTFKVSMSNLYGEWEEYLSFCKKVIEWWDTHDAIKKEENYLYLLDYFNYLSACVELKYFERIPSALKEMEKWTTTNAIEERVLFVNLVKLKHMYYMNLGKFEMAKQEYLKVDEELIKLNLEEKTRMTLIANFAVLLFFMEDFKGATKAIDKITKNKNVENRISIQRFIRVLKCICYLEMQEIDKFDSTYTAARRFLISTNKEEKNFELEILSCLKQIEAALSRDKKLLYKNFKNLLQEEKNNPSKFNLPGLDEYYFWIQSKLTKNSMTKLLLDSLENN